MKLLYIKIKNNVIRNVVALCILMEFTNGYPIRKKDVEINPEQVHEKTYPNGTVVGKYYYKDNEGNPVHVKYYADDYGYGVELKTVKVSAPSASERCHDKTKLKYLLKPDDDVDVSSSTIFNPISISDHLTSSKPTETFLKDLKSTEAKPSPDYEIFEDNEFKAPKKCGHDKVHVYYEKNKRKSRDTLSDFDALRYCEQMFS